MEGVEVQSLEAPTLDTDTRRSTPLCQRPRPLPHHAASAGGRCALIVVLVLGGGLAVNWRLVRLVVASYFPPPVPEAIAWPLPDKPSLVVLPFTNLSGDASQEYFSDGMTDDLINTLAQFPDLFVVARQSRLYLQREDHQGARRLGSELGVRYVLASSWDERTGRCG